MNKLPSKNHLLRGAVQEKSALKINALLLPVSTPNHMPSIKEHSPNKVVSLLIKGGALEHRIGGRSLQEESDKIDDFAKRVKESLPAGSPRWYWNWQQLLRALRGHGHLEQVWLIGSSGKDGSRQACSEFCKPWLEGYLPPGCKVQIYDRGVDFEDYNEMENCFRTIVFGPLESFNHTSVCVDVTGGQKTTSIAAAAMTMNREVVFQYVQTNSPFATLIYDIALEEPHVHGGLT